MNSTLHVLPNNSRLWIFAADAKLATEAATNFLARASELVAQWSAHGKQLRAGAEMRYDQFLFVAADEKVEAPSGCSIDTLTREIGELGRQFGVNFLAASRIFYRADDEIKSADRLAMKSLIASGALTPETIVLNNTLTTLGDLREGKWEVPAAQSWHSAYLAKMAS